MTILTPFAADMIGFAGSFALVAAYIYSNVAKLVSLVTFNVLNLIGATLLAVSLTVNYNLPTLVLEFVWMAIALYGLSKTLLARRAQS